MEQAKVTFIGGLILSTGIWITSDILEKIGKYEISETSDKVAKISFVTTTLVSILEVLNSFKQN